MMAAFATTSSVVTIGTKAVTVPVTSIDKAVPLGRTKNTNPPQVLTVRPYSSITDKQKLDDICRDVWNGTDYLPAMAPVFEQDPTCNFLFMEDRETGRAVAAGNLRVFDAGVGVDVDVDVDRDSDDGTETETEIGTASGTVWIEAIRVSSDFKGKGIATALMKEFCQRSRDMGARKILSCTIYENFAMKKIFNKIHMRHVGNLYFTDFQTLKALPGWAADSNDNVNTDTTTNSLKIAGASTTGKAQNILKALDLEHLVEEAVKLDEWETIESEEELKSILDTIRKNHGGTGYLPGIGKLLWTSDEMRSSIRKGLIRKLVKSTSTASSLSDTHPQPISVMALVKDSAIKSLRSQYVCSIVATSAYALESALWESCRSENAALMGECAFALIYDGCFTPESESELDRGPQSKSESESTSTSALVDALPIKKENPFVIFSRTIQA